MSPAQMSLLAPSGRARPSDPETSHTAAAQNRARLVDQVRDALHRHPSGMTDHEITAALGLPERRKPSVGKRRQEIGATDTGRRRPSPDGHDCVVWTLNPEGT